MIPRIQFDDRRDVRIFARAISDPYFVETLPVLDSIFARSLVAQTGNQSHLDIQRILLFNILDADSDRRMYQRYKALFGAAIQSLVSSNADVSRVSLAQQRFEDMQRAEISAKWVTDVLRSIGDGMAWRFLNYDRTILRLLAEHAPVAIPQPNKGLFSEIQELLRMAYEENTPVILNAITNFLRVGDLTKRDPVSGQVSVVEVKSGTTTTARTERQRNHLNAVQDGLDSGVHLMGGEAIRSLVARRPLRTHVHSVERAMKEAKAKFGSSRLFGDFLSVAVFHQQSIVNELRDDEWELTRTPHMDRLKAVRKYNTDIATEPMNSLFSLTRFSPNMAPYSVFPIAKDLRLGLMTGEFIILSMVNVTGFARWMRGRGWHAEVINPPEEFLESDAPTMLPILRAGKGQLSVEVDFTLFHIAAAEFWMPESLETAIETDLASMQPRHRLDRSAYCQVSFPNTGRYAWD